MSTDTPIPPKQFITVKGHRLAQVEVGSGDPIVLLYDFVPRHRIGQHHQRSPDQTRVKNSLAGGVEITAIHQCEVGPGHGG